MGQASVLAILEMYPDKWLSVKDISRIGGIGRQSTTVSCAKLRRFGDVEYSEARDPNGIIFYVYKFRSVR